MSGLAGQAIGLETQSPTPIGGDTAVDAESKGSMENFIGFGLGATSYDPAPVDFDAADDTVTSAADGSTRVAPEYTDSQLTWGGAGPTFDPASLFASGEQGAWYDFSDLTTMFQDRAGTTQVTADGQTVGKILDKSGRGNHATAPSDTARPLYKTDGTSHWLLGDGIDDCLISGNIDLTAHANIVFWTGISASDPALDGVHTAIGLGPQVYSENGSFSYIVGGANNRASVLLRGTQVTSQVSIYTDTGGKNLMTMALDISKPTSNEEIIPVTNGGTASNWGAGEQPDAGTSNFGNLPIALFSTSAGQYSFAGKNYGLILRAGETAVSDKEGADKWIFDKMPGTSSMAIGDSIVSFYSGLVSVFWGITTSTDRELLLAESGNTISQQLQKFLDYQFKYDVSWVGIQVGVNDLGYTESAATVLGRLQSLVNQVRSGIPAGAKIMICQLTPCKQRLISMFGSTNGAIAYQQWLDINVGISGGGSTPITGANVVATNHVAALNDGSGNLAAAYNYGDDVHPNNAGRQIISDSWVAALQSIGVTP